MSKEQAMTEYVNKIRTLDKEWDPQSIKSGMGISVSVMNHEHERVLTEGEKTIFDHCKEGSLKKVMDSLDGFPKDDEGRTLLHWACDRGHLEIVQFLISKGHDVNCKDTEASTPLHYAASCDHLKIVEFLLANRADFTVKDDDDETPVDCATSKKTKIVFEKFQKFSNTY